MSMNMRIVMPAVMVSVAMVASSHVVFAIMAVVMEWAGDKLRCLILLLSHPLSNVGKVAAACWKGGDNVDEPVPKTLCREDKRCGKIEIEALGLGITKLVDAIDTRRELLMC